ncbi:hypothetical protein [Mycobacterium sp. C31M]
MDTNLNITVTGLIGRQLVPLLTAVGHHVVAASRATGVDLLSGDGLAGRWRAPTP